MGRREARWGAFTDAELQALADCISCNPHPAKYLGDMYGP